MLLPVWVFLVSLAVAAIFGGWLHWLSQRGRSAVQQRREEELLTEHRRLQGEASRGSSLASAYEATARLERERAERGEAARDRLIEERKSLSDELVQATTQLENERRQSGEKLALLDDARGQLAKDFEVVAGKILEDKSTRFTEQNRINLDGVLGPLKDQLTDFRKKVEEAQTTSTIQNAQMEVRLAQMATLNGKLSQEASNLARALRASPGKAGQLGEDFLRRVLETMGLQEGVNFRRQESLKDQAGETFRPDFILDLPGSRHIVIDAKMSLKGYDDYCNAEDERSRETSLSEHLKSVRAHIVGLSSKNYQSLHGLNSPDFVVMFMPIEPAFHVAISNDDNLWMEASSRNVLLVSPSTLLFVVRTVADLWKQERQTQDVKKIVERGGALYDKFVGFVHDLESVGSYLDRAKAAYGEAHGKLSLGPGNLVHQADQLRALGVRVKGKKKGKRQALAQQLVAAARESAAEEHATMLMLPLGPPGDAEEQAEQT